MEDSDSRHYLPPEYAIEVYRTQNDMIAISQQGSFGNAPEAVIVSPERMDRLILLLRAVKDEILTDRADAAEARTKELPPLSNG